MNVNEETIQYVRRAMRSLDPSLDDPFEWPGHDFGMDGEAGKALLGSAVGRWPGHFLMQQKRQLNGDNYIEKVSVFKSDKAGSLPYFLFYVAKPGIAQTTRFGIGIR